MIIIIPDLSKPVTNKIRMLLLLIVFFILKEKESKDCEDFFEFIFIFLETNADSLCSIITTIITIIININNDKSNNHNNNKHNFYSNFKKLD